MKRILFGLGAIACRCATARSAVAVALLGLSACAAETQSASTPLTSESQPVESPQAAPNLPLYEVSWDGYLNGKRVANRPVEVYVWGSPSLQEHPNFTSRGVLVQTMGNPLTDEQVYSPAFESYGCFPQVTSPGEKELLRTDHPVLLPKANPERVPIEVRVRPIDAQLQQEIVDNGDKPTRSIPLTSCHPVRD